MSVFDQRFDPGRGEALDRVAVPPFVVIGLGALLNFEHRWHGGLTLDGQTHFLRLAEARAGADLRIGFAVRTGVTFGKHF